MPNACVGSVGEPVEFVPAADVTAVGQRPHAEGADFLRHRFAVVRLAAGHDDVSAALRERERHRASEAAASAGDKGNLAAQIEKFCYGHV